jgi:hypothetical protein
MNIKTLHKEFLIKDRFIVKIYRDEDGEYSARSFIIKDDRSIEDLNGFGFNCEKVSNDDELISELMIQFQSKSD